MSEDDNLKTAVVELIARSLDARALAATVASRRVSAGGGTGSTAADLVLSRIALGDLLDDAILSSKPGERSFPLRLLFAELASWVTREGDDEHEGRAVEAAFCLAAALNFYFRTLDTDEESRITLAIETSRAFYRFAREAPIDPDLVAKAGPALAALMGGDLEHVTLEAVEHGRFFDAQLHRRAGGANPMGTHVLAPATFLCRMSTTATLKVKAEVWT